MVESLFAYLAAVSIFQSQFSNGSVCFLYFFLSLLVYFIDLPFRFVYCLLIADDGNIVGTMRMRHQTY